MRSNHLSYGPLLKFRDFGGWIPAIHFRPDASARATRELPGPGVPHPRLLQDGEHLGRHRRPDRVVKHRPPARARPSLGAGRG